MGGREGCWERAGVDGELTGQRGRALIRTPALCSPTPAVCQASQQPLPVAHNITTRRDNKDTGCWKLFPGQFQAAPPPSPYAATGKGQARLPQGPPGSLGLLWKLL